MLNSLGNDRPLHLVGLSQGAPIAAAYANHYPDRVASITLIDPLISPVKPKTILPMNVPLLGDYFARVILIPHILPKLQAGDFYQPDNFPAWENKFRDQMQYEGFAGAMLSSIRGLPSIDPLVEYKNISRNQFPFLLIWGREDQSIPYNDIETLVNIAPNVELHIIENAGHLPHFEQPGIVNPILVSFLTELQ